MENLTEYKQLCTALSREKIVNLFLVKWGARPAFLYASVKKLDKKHWEHYRLVADIMGIKLLVCQRTKEMYHVLFLNKGTDESEFLENMTNAAFGKLLGYVVPGSAKVPFLQWKYKTSRLWSESLPDVSNATQKLVDLRLEQFYSKIPAEFLKHFSTNVKTK